MKNAMVRTWNRKGWFTLFPVEPSFLDFLYLLRGVELGQPENGTMRYRFQGMERTYTASDHGRRIMVHERA